METTTGRNGLAAHLQDVALAYGRWFGAEPAKPQWAGFPLIEYRVPGAAALFFADSQILRYTLALPPSVEAMAEQLRGHVGPENWARWESTRAAVASHIDEVISIWQATESSLAPRAQSCGLAPSDKPALPQAHTDEPVDTYLPALFVQSIWNEPEFFDSSGVHSWDRVQVREETAVISMRHTLDTVQTFVFADSNMVRSQNRDSVELMKRAWEEEALRLEHRIRGVRAKRAGVVSAVEEFRALVAALQSDYLRTSTLPGTCPRCAELKASAAP